MLSLQCVQELISAGLIGVAQRGMRRMHAAPPRAQLALPFGEEFAPTAADALDVPPAPPKRQAPPEVFDKRPLDWFFVIVDLERKGYTLQAIGQSIGRSKGTVGGWRCGDHEPGYEGGEALVGLWMSVTGKGRAELPRRLVVGFSAARVK